MAGYLSIVSSSDKLDDFDRLVLTYGADVCAIELAKSRAIAFAVESGRFNADSAQALVDRVAIWPGQLTAYDTGGLEFFALRELVEKTLGDRFDIREFHAVVLENGAMTLPMLREHVNHWLRTQH